MQNIEKLPAKLTPERVIACRALVWKRGRNDQDVVRPHPPGTLLEGKKAIEQFFGSLEQAAYALDIQNGGNTRGSEWRIVRYRLPSGEVLQLETEDEATEFAADGTRRRNPDHPGPLDSEKSAPFHGENVSVVVNGERRMAFVPGPLSRLPPPDWGRLTPALGAASRAVGALQSIRNLLPNPDHYLEGCVRREALFSSQIEGTQSSLDDLMLIEGGPEPNDDAAETSNYVKALRRGISHLREELPGALPMSLRLLLDLHQILLRSGRGAGMGPGEFRRNQNWVGEHVPPPPNRVPECMGELENFIANPAPDIPPLIRAGLAHVQFETIHPFRDGNGRMGRLLIALMLINEEELDEPWLYVSLPIKKTRREYYDRLHAVRTEGDWTGWLLYFLQVVADAAKNTVETAQEADKLFRRDKDRITDSVGVRSHAPFAVHEALQRFHISSIPRLEKETGFSYPAVKDALKRLGEIDIVRPFDDRRWAKRFVYHEYREILHRDGEPL